MAFKDFSGQLLGVRLLQRSIERKRLGHAYLFSGDMIGELEALARALAKTLNCAHPVKSGDAAVDCCDACASCRKIEAESHPDIHWARPESKSRVVTVDQMRELMREIQLKPNEAAFKVAVVSGADRLNAQAANAFLKTLEEPPARSVIVLLSTEPSRILETVLSRCLRLNFAADAARPLSPAQSVWLQQFSSAAAAAEKSLMGRYRLLDALQQRLRALRESAEEELAARSPLEKYDDLEKDLRQRWEAELNAAIESEYRLRRGETLLLLEWWFRDVWLHTLSAAQGLMRLPEIAGAGEVAERITPAQARKNLEVLEETQRLLRGNVQEALALEVALLKLHL